jgi:hypothetical protein
VCYQDLALLLALDLIFPRPAQILEQTRRPVFPVPFSVQQPSLGLSFSPFVELSLNQFRSSIPPGRPSFSSVVIFCAIFHVFSTGVSTQTKQCFLLMPKCALASSLPPTAIESTLTPPADTASVGFGVLAAAPSWAWTPAARFFVGLWHRIFLATASHVPSRSLLNVSKERV